MEVTLEVKVSRVSQMYYQKIYVPLIHPAYPVILEGYPVGFFLQGNLLVF